MATVKSTVLVAVFTILKVGNLTIVWFSFTNVAPGALLAVKKVLVAVNVPTPLSLPLRLSGVAAS
ncbi:hypothetical protein MGSAQ_000529 [marine sediment metagenome]|uniref:Uncharacterized protein n=1 Tax=marine sediment metagenome TaxID=412755 RepID=A0A1B6NWZ5_9ZZZZ